ncbi:MAG: GatB/YqeY domain-containing protein [Negativicoccus succinicivorans]|uniref:YqeY-like protein n=1 Tax=Negativicoccus succinicivorans DORA_17_25 TaxID=1403945 RepID=W1TW95_9FIRM|nr:GatB/YqeY domain-containing protein [Negativicoccus succinicivorans]ETI85882.1 MAG: YqeY-like protein [Negativicoccus succinicivorans DORA_17_25]MBS5916924.1 GatB/YqeY domain-containing protein [Negativicoccus succinicivorans]
MTIQETLQRDMKEVMKAKEDGKLALSVIRMARAAIKNAEIDSSEPLAEEDVIGILAKEMKLRKDSLAEFEKSDRHDLITQTKAEIEVLSRYLPQPVSAEEVGNIVAETAFQLAPEERNIGTLMKAVMPRLKGRADGKVVNQAVREWLASNK